MQSEIFRDLAIIIVFAKIFALIARKFKAPQVVGEIIAGLLIGPSLLGLVTLNDASGQLTSVGSFLTQMAEIGVLLLMFSAGLETNLKDLIKTGPKALAIACCGVFIPLIGGSLLYMGYYHIPPVWGDEKFLSAIFIGVIMTATSVSITVESLKEMGKLKGEIGQTILSAAIIDDVIGIIVLTFVIGLKNPESGSENVVLMRLLDNIYPMNAFVKVIILTILFFALAAGLGYGIYMLFKLADFKFPHTRRIPILGLALCFVFAWLAENFFGIADITGAYVAGIILCSLKDSEYIAEKMDTNSYMLFGPIFFASIGLKTDISNVNGSIILFCIAFVIVALVTKIVGCGLISKALGFKWGDSLKIGVGMMTRGEVALIVAQKGLAVGMVDSVYFTAVILLIIVSSISTPIILKLLYSKDVPEAEAKA